MELNQAELQIVREWFNSLEDTNEKYLEKPDYDLYQKIMIHLSMRISESTLKRMHNIGEG